MRLPPQDGLEATHTVAARGVPRRHTTRRPGAQGGDPRAVTAEHAPTGHRLRTLGGRARSVDLDVATAIIAAADRHLVRSVSPCRVGASVSRPSTGKGKAARPCAGPRPPGRSLPPGNLLCHQPGEIRVERHRESAYGAPASRFVGCRGGSPLGWRATRVGSRQLGWLRSGTQPSGPPVTPSTMKPSSSPRSCVAGCPGLKLDDGPTSGNWLQSATSAASVDEGRPVGGGPGRARA